MPFEQTQVIRDCPGNVTGLYGPVWIDNDLLKECMKEILEIPLRKVLGDEPKALERLALQIIQHMGGG